MSVMAGLNVLPVGRTLLLGSSRSYATLKEISMRLRSVKNIQKITKSMKMVSASKYARAERELRPARSYGIGATTFFEKAEVKQDEKAPNHLMIAFTSDRGLCGSVHSNVFKEMRNQLEEKPDGTTTKIVAIGDKSRLIFQRYFPKNLLFGFTEVGKQPPTFMDAAMISQFLLRSGFKYDYGTMTFNRFRSVVSYKTLTKPFYHLSSVNQADKLSLYDSVDDEVLQSYMEFNLTNLIYYGMKESACSEQSSRMTAMDAASKNAGEMIDKLTLRYNRTRQAVITRELIEIISGAAAV